MVTEVSAVKNNTYIIAEISANHNGSLESAIQLISEAKRAGADAVKIQTYTADTLTLDSDNEYFRIEGGTLWDGRTLHNLYHEAHTPWDWHHEIFASAKKEGIECFSTPFDETAVDFLEQFDPPYHKVASFELTHHPLLVKIARTGRPVIMSTGMGSREEIQESVGLLRKNGCGDITLLKCTSSYPAPLDEANLARIPEMAHRYGVRAGLSDHTMGFIAPLTAVALGAKVIEKHLCHSRQDPGPDSAFSMEPAEFGEMVVAIRSAESAIGTVSYELTAAEEKSLAFRRSLFYANNLPAGHILTTEDVRVVRPAHGLPPSRLHDVVGRTIRRGVTRATPVRESDISKPA